jgi:pimeloyl-ACP methyl ester carboxylesterase
MKSRDSGATTGCKPGRGRYLYSVAMSSRSRAVHPAILVLTVAVAACAAPPSASNVPSASAAASASAIPSPSASPGLPVAADPGAYYPTVDAIAAAAPGDVIQSVEINAPAGMRAWFVVYGSTGLDGKPVADSGMVLAPEAPPGEAGYPVVAWAHGTTGIADDCAPSKQGVEGIPADVRYLVAEGYVVTATDYDGLGTAGVHPYLIGISEGRSVLDSIRAVQGLADAHGAPDAVVIGHSQGGHAALWTAELAPAYAPGLTLLGALAASPPTDLLAWDTWAFHEAAAGTLDRAAAPVLLFGVYNAIYDAPLNFLTNAGRQSALAGRESCFAPPVSSTPYLSDPAGIPEWRNLLARNSPGLALTGVPIRVISPKADEAVQYDSQVAGVTTMCNVGDTVELQTIAGDHFASIEPPAAWAEVTAWITDRFAGVEAVTTCAPLPT